MFKRSQENMDVDALISKLLGGSGGGSSAPSEPVSEEPTSFTQQQYYQLPVKHTRGGALIDEENKPWVVGHFYPGKYLNPTHPGGHNGVDLKAPRGTSIYPIGPGKVEKTPEGGKGGKTVYITHEDGKVRSYYAHLDSVSVKPGQEVGLSTVIGTMGDTGNAKGRGAHLHYEVRVDGSHVDPKSIAGKPVGSLSKKAEFIRNVVAELNKYAHLESVQKEFPSAQLAPSRKEAEQFVIDVAPELVYGHILKCRSLKQCSGVAPLFAAVASRAGFATLVSSVPGHFFNIMLTEEGPLGVDLTVMQFYMNRVARKILAAEEETDEYDDMDIYGERRAAEKLLEELHKNPYKTVRIWPMERPRGGPSENKDIMGQERIIYYDEGSVDPDYASEKDHKVINEPHPLGEIMTGSRKTTLRKIAEDVGFKIKQD